MRLADVPDDILADYLVKMKGFSRSGAKACVANFRDTMKFANLDLTTEYERQTRWNAALRTATPPPVAGAETP